jgi:translocation and assembly module TamB
LKKLLFLFMIAIVSITVIVTILVNTPVFIKNVTHDFLQEHNITYKKIDGDVLQGVSFYDVKYNKKSIATKLQFFWSPLSLIEKKIVIHKVNIEDLNITNLTKLAKSFKSDNNKTTQKLDFTFVLQKANITTTKYSYKHYIFNSMKAELSNVSYDIYNNKFNSGEINYTVDLNYGKINLYAKVVGDFEFKGKGNLSVNQTFYDRYHVPLIASNAGNANISEFNVSKTGFTILADTKGNNIFKDLNATNNLDALEVNSKISYNWKTKNVIVDSNAIAKSYYAPVLKITNYVVVDKNRKAVYSGTVKADKITSLNPKLIQILTSPKAVFKGKEKSLSVALDTKDFKGVFITNDFKTGLLKANSKKQISIKDFLYLPKSLEASTGNIEITVPTTFKKPFFKDFEAIVESDLVNLNGKVTNDGGLWTIDTKVASVPTNSILKKDYSFVKWDSFVGSNIILSIKNNITNINIKSKDLVSNVDYSNSTNAINGIFSLSGISGSIDGNTKGNILVKSNSSDMQSSLNSLSKYLDFTPPLMSGDSKFDLIIDTNGKTNLTLNSSSILLGDKSRYAKPVTDIKAQLTIDGSKITIDEYSFLYDKLQFFATKQSIINFSNGILDFNSLWVNDQLFANGKYDIKTKNGDFSINGKNIFISHEYATLKLNADLKANIKNNAINLNGNLVVLEGDILYYLGQKTFPTDSDIIILQEEKQKTPSPLIDNLSMSLKIHTLKPLRYKQRNSSFQVNLDLGVEKVAGESILVIGGAKILQGGYYFYEDKKFILQPSGIYFTGDADRPMLDIQAVYEAPNYTIRTIVTGTPGSPIVNFSSTPKLTKEQILALIMFDSEVEADKYTTDEMMKMMGGAVAKSLLSNMGISFDHLVFGSNNSVEVGKKINRRTTLIYANDEVSKAKLRYEFNPSIDGELSVSKKSTSADIIYKKEFKNFKDLFSSSQKDNNTTH